MLKAPGPASDADAHRAQQAWVIMHNQVNRDILNISFKTAFVFKTAAETRGFKELQEARHDAAGDIHRQTSRGSAPVPPKRPIMTQNSDSARRQSVQLSASARSVTSRGCRFSGSRPSDLTIARYRLTSPGPESTRSAETCPSSARSSSRMILLLRCSGQNQHDRLRPAG